MEWLGPWGTSKRIAVAVSGGADSLALAWLLSRWGAPAALIVDHGLRAESAAECRLTADRLAGFGVPASILTLALPPGARIGARARAARYDAMIGAAVSGGFADLLLGHHAGDQAETFLMRQASGSAAAGLAGMPAIRETHALRLVRPLLGVSAGRLRATLLQAGLGWIEDPSNRDIRTARGLLRAQLADPAGLAAQAARHAVDRAAEDAVTAAQLALHAAIHPEGYAVLAPGPTTAAVLARLIRALTGAPYPVPLRRLAGLAANPAEGTVGGVRLMTAGRLGGGLLLVREAAAMAAPVRAVPGAVWDRRFRLAANAKPDAGATLGAVGADARHLRRDSDLPAAILATLPAIRVNGTLQAVPHLSFPDIPTCARLKIGFAPATRAAGAAFSEIRPGGAGPPVFPCGPDCHRRGCASQSAAPCPAHAAIDRTGVRTKMRLPCTGLRALDWKT